MKLLSFIRILLAIMLLHFLLIEVDAQCADPQSTEDGSPCAFQGIRPFCTDLNPYGITYASGTVGNAFGSYFPDTNRIACLESAPAPAWYYLRVSEPGEMLFLIQQFDADSMGIDVDFACWGPFQASSNFEFVENLCCGVYSLNTTHYANSHVVDATGHHQPAHSWNNPYPWGNLIDCSFDIAPTEWCYIPNAQEGEYYLLLITNYAALSGLYGTITFSTATNTADSLNAVADCSITETVASNSPVCENDTLFLYCNTPSFGVTYLWNGPNGWTSNEANPVIPQVSADMNGLYTLVLTNGIDTTDADSLFVVVHQQPDMIMSLSSNPVCQHDTVVVSAFGADQYLWQDSTSESSFTVVVDSSQYVLLTGYSPNCQLTDSILIEMYTPQHESETVTACESYTWHGTTYTQSGTYHYVHTDNNGCLQDDTLHLTIYHHTQSVVYHYIVENQLAGWQYHGNHFGGNTDTLIHIQNAVGCDSAVHYHLHVYPNLHVTLDSVLCENELPLLWNGETFTASDERVVTIPASTGADSVITMRVTVHYNTTGTDVQTACESYTWIDGQTYTETPETAPVHTIVGGNQWGCDSVVTLQLTVWHAQHESDTVTACESYTWNGTAYTQSDTYLYEHQDAHGCTQVDTLHLTINYNTQSTVYDTIVENQLAGWQYHGNHFGGNTDTIIHIQNAVGCDSAVHYHLHVYPNLYVTLDSVLCENELPLLWNGETFTASDERVVTILASTGADSVITMRVTVHYNTTGTDVQTACESYTWIDGQTYTETLETAPVHTIVGGNHWGCDSVVTLQLTVWHAQHESDTVTACESFTWNGTAYTQSGTYHYTHPDVHGCTQVDTLHLMVNYNTQSAVYDTIVENQLAGWQYHGNHFGGDTDTIIHIQNALGCDSAVHYHLHVYPNLYVTLDSVLCENELPLIWNGETFTASDERVVTILASTGADSVITMRVTVHYNTTGTDVQTACESYIWIDGQTYTETPETAPVHTIVGGNQWGCDSVVTLQLTVWHAQHESDTVTACESFTWNGTAYTQSGTYQYEHPDVHGCTQVDTLHLTVNYNTQSAVYDTIVENQLAGWQYHGNHFGGNTDTLIHIQNAVGCDSAVHYHLHVYPNLHVTLDSVLCENELPLLWNGETFTASDERVVTVLASTGADSVITMRVTVHYNTTGTDVQTAYESYTWIDGQTYTETPETAPVHTLVGGNQWGCDSVVTLQLTVWHAQHESDMVTACESYTWNGTTYTQSGTYQYEHLDVHGCTQVDTLHLTVNYNTQSAVYDTIVENQLVSWQYLGNHFSGTTDTLVVLENAVGCDSVVSYHLYVYPSLHVTLDSVLCENELPLIWNGETFTASDERVVTILASTGADSIITMQVTVHYNTAGTDVQTACESYTWIDGQTYTETPETAPVHTLVGGNQWGCDSVVTLQLTVWHAQHESDTVTACESFTWHGTAYTQSDTYLYEHQDAHGCTQVDTLHLTVNYNTQSTVYDTIVENQLVSWQYLGNHFIGTTDTLVVLENAVGCDSIVSYHLYVYPNLHVTLDSVLCENELPLIWNGETFTASDERVVTVLASTGADSVITMRVTVHYNTTGTDVQTACESYTWIDGQTYTETPATAPVHTLVGGNRWGCDSVVTLQLTVYHPVHSAVSITECESYLWTSGDGQLHLLSGDYTHAHPDAHGCIQVDTLHLTIRHHTQSSVFDTIVENQLSSWQYHGLHFSGSSDTSVLLQNMAGCDSAVSYNLYVYPNLYVTLDSVLCENELPLVWNGETFMGSDIKVVTLLASTGADSIVTMQVSVLNNSIFYDERTSCGPFTWIDGQLYTESNQEATYILTNAVGCDSIIALNLTLIDTTLTIVPSTDDYCDELTMTLTAEGDFNNYLWNTGETSQSVEVEHSGLYRVTAMHDPCEASASIEIPFCELNIYLPNAFSPSNQDGLNDLFGLDARAQHQIEDCSIYIYNRWGELVFYSNRKEFQWDGRVNGKLMTDAIYNYVLYYTNKEKRPFVKKGSITVL